MSYMKILEEALELLSEEVYLEEILSHLIQSLKNIFKPVSCGIITWKNEFRVRISRGWSYSYIKKLHAEGKHPLTEELKRQKTPLFITKKHSLYPQGFEHDYDLLVLFPLIQVSEVIGALVVNLRGREELSEEEKEFLRALSLLVSLSISHYELKDKLSEMNNIDTLTGLYNYKHFHELLYNEVLRAEETGHCFSLALIAINGIKEFNEQFGHVKGDELIKSVGSFIKERVRRFDVVARYGGAKFVVIFPEATKAEAKEILEKILSEFEKTSWAKTAPRVFLDVGLVTYPEDARDEKVLLARLEECAHEARRRGGGLVPWPFK